LAPATVVVEDESHKHRGHRENSGLGETHLNLEVVSEKFEGVGLVARHRMVYEVIEEEMKERVHAVGLKTKTPAEAAATKK